MGEKRSPAPTLAARFLTSTEHHGGCGVCNDPRITDEIRELIDAAGKLDARGKRLRGSQQVVAWLKAEGLWPSGWTYGRIESHWSHSG